MATTEIQNKKKKEMTSNNNKNWAGEMAHYVMFVVCT